MTTTASDHSLSTSRASARWKRDLAGWKVYALAGGASLAAATSADAQIVYSTVGQSVSGAGTSSKLSFAVNGHVVFAAQTHTAGNAGASDGVGLIGAVGGIKFYNRGLAAVNYQKGAAIGKSAANLNSGVAFRTVHRSGGGKWTTHGNFGSVNANPTRAAAASGYVGFKTSGGDKGWIKVKVGPSGNTNAGVAIMVAAYAYNSSGGPINAGDTGAVPEPGTMALVLMAAGAAGLTAIRRARARVASDDRVEAEVVAS